MLQSFRDNLKGTVATILVVLIIIPFALFGVDSLFTGGASVNSAAEINGEKITETELRRAILSQKQRLEEQVGSNAPAGFFSEERLRDPVLKGLIQRLLLAQAAKREGMVISDDSLNDMIVSAEQFQLEGKFNPERYSQLLRNLGFTPSSYKRLLTQDLLLNQHSTGISDSSFVTDAELQRAVELSQQTRDFYYLTIPLIETEQQAEVSVEKIQAYYDEHKDAYMDPEQAAIQYLDVSADNLALAVDVSEETIKQHYDDYVAAFKADTQREAAHILIERKEDGSEQALLTELQSRLTAGEEFSKLAKQYSEDLGTKEQGGYLGMSTGDTFPGSFEAALENLKVGEVSTPVETDDGFHLIKLMGVNGSEPRSFEDERAKISRTIRQAEGEEMFLSTLDKLGDLAYNADDLATVATELGVAVKTSGLFGRQGGTGITANSEVLSAVFSDEVLLERNTSDVLELSGNRAVVLRVTQHKPASVKPLEAVRAEISTLLKHEVAKEHIAAKGEELLQAVADGQSIEEAAKANSYQWQVNLATRRNDPKVSRELLQHIFSLPKPTDKPLVKGFQLANGDYTLVSLTKAQGGVYDSMAMEQKRSLRAQMEGQFGSSDFVAYEALLKEQGDIEIYSASTEVN